MSALRAPLLPRLRRHPLLWVLVAVVLLTKLVSSSVCAADLQTAGNALPQTPVVAVAAPATGDGGCLLGESTCHCACAETLPIPAMTVANLATVAPALAVPHTKPAFAPIAIESQLRPPIA